MNQSPLAHILVLITFLTNTLGPMPVTYAQDITLPKPGVMVHLSPPMNPPVLKGITVHPDNPFKFDFILDKGDEDFLASPTRGHVQDRTTENVSPSPMPSDVGLTTKAPQGNQGSTNDEKLEQESKKLIKYFLSAITTPEKDLWVNLSPYEKNRIIPESFGQTDMGRDLLAQDYILKQITASLIYPEDEVGKKFWKRIYEEAAQKYGTTNIPVNTFNKVWIVPDHAKVYEHGNTAFVVKARLKVMLEQDYLSMQKQLPLAPSLKKEGGVNLVSPLFYKEGIKGSSNDINTLGSQIIRELIIPELEREVNEGKNFAQLRQVYHSLILAVWFKKRMKDSLLGRKYMDQNKINGIQRQNMLPMEAMPTRGHVPLSRNVSPSRLPSDNGLNVKATQRSEPNDVEAIYQRYLQVFKIGVYNYIKEEPDPVTGNSVPRKYFSGGAEMSAAMTTTEFTRIIVPDDNMQVSDGAIVTVNLGTGENQAQVTKIPSWLAFNRMTGALAKVRSFEELDRIPAAQEVPFERGKKVWLTQRIHVGGQGAAGLGIYVLIQNPTGERFIANTNNVFHLVKEVQAALAPVVNEKKESVEWMTKGSGWKLHLNFDSTQKEILQKVDHVLKELKDGKLIYHYKIGRSSGQVSKEATVYIGHGQKARIVAEYLQSALSEELLAPAGDTLFDDVLMAEKIMGRFDMPRKDREFHQYGYKGVCNLLSDLHREGVTKEEARQRAYNLLSERLGEYFTDGFSYSEHSNTIQPSPPTNPAMNASFVEEFTARWNQDRFDKFNYRSGDKLLMDPEGNIIPKISDEGANLIFHRNNGPYKDLYFRLPKISFGGAVVDMMEKGFKLGVDNGVTPPSTKVKIGNEFFLVVAAVKPVEGARTLEELTKRSIIDDSYIKAVEDLFRSMVEKRLSFSDPKLSNIVVGYLNGEFGAWVIDADLLQQEDGTQALVATKFLNEISNGRNVNRWPQDSILFKRVTELFREKIAESLPASPAMNASSDRAMLQTPTSLKDWGDLEFRVAGFTPEDIKVWRTLANPPGILSVGPAETQIKDYYRDADLSGTKYMIKEEIGRRFDAHGMSSGGVVKFVKLLVEGIDRQRVFYTSSLNPTPGIGGTVAAHMDGLFLLVSEVDGVIGAETSNIKYVVVQSKIYENKFGEELLNVLRNKFPQIKFIKAFDKITGKSWVNVLEDTVEEYDKKYTTNTVNLTVGKDKYMSVRSGDVERKYRLRLTENQTQNRELHISQQTAAGEYYPLYKLTTTKSQSFGGSLDPIKFNVLFISGRNKIIVRSAKSVQIKITDHAQLSGTINPGGIDLTAERMKVEVESDKARISQPMDLKMLENIEINGLYIKDIEIKPLDNLLQLLGVPAQANL